MCKYNYCCLQFAITIFYNYWKSKSQFGNNEQYSVINDITITSYTWTSPLGWIGISTTNSINYIVGANAGLITVTPSNICGSGPVRTLYVSTGYTLSGYFTYDNTYNTL